MAETPRGIRNHNPGNIELTSEQWLGAAREQKDGRFIQFIHPFWGLRALTIILTNYHRKHGLNTLEQIFDRYAPSNENNTNAYALFVANKLNVAVNQKLDLTNVLMMRDLTRAICMYENRGLFPYGDELHTAAVEVGMGLRPTAEVVKLLHVPTEDLDMVSIDPPKMDPINPVNGNVPAQPQSQSQSLTVEQMMELINKAVDERVKAGQLSTVVAGAIKSKTMWFAGFVALMPELINLAQEHLNNMPAPEDKYRWAMWLVAFGIAALRLITKEPVAQKALK